MLIELYLRAFALLQRRHLLVLAVIALAWLGAVALLPRLTFDMSFRPLFSTDAQLNAATARYEREFAQSSGAYLVAILESDTVLTDPFLDRLGQLSDRVARVPHVNEVVSLAHLQVPLPADDGLRIGNVLEAIRAEVDDGTPAAQTLADLPGVRGTLLSADGKRTLLLARVDLPLSDLAGRRPVIAEFQRVVTASAPAGARVYFTGVSVVEDAYARLVLRNMLIGVGLTVSVTALALFLLLGDYRSVTIALAGVSIATPLTLAIMALIGQPMTIINSMVASMILIIGVADAIHMQQDFAEHRDQGSDVPSSVRNMLRDTALPCFLTCGTTAVGFLSLQSASLEAIRDFGLNVAIGVALVFVLNQLLVPILLSLWTPKRLHALPLPERLCNRWIDSTNRVVARRSPWLLAGMVVLVVASGYSLSRLEVVQRFNEELPREHPVRVAQHIIERDFGGFLGPELLVQRRDGAVLLTDDAAPRLQALHDTVASHPGVLSVRSPSSYWLEPVQARDLLAWREASPLTLQLHEVIGAEGRAVSLIVRTGDMGTRNAAQFHDRLLGQARRELGNEYTVELVGQWWLAQKGMMNILDDMVSSLLWSGVVILPLMLLLLRNASMFVASLVPNVLPVLLALAYMAAMGITLRIGTAMILAGTIGIAFDDSIHFILRLRREAMGGKPPIDAVRSTIASTGKAVLLTTLVLLGGFLSMVSNDLNAIRDMGQVAAVAFAGGFLADLYLAPALYLMLSKREEGCDLGASETVG